MTAFLPLGRGEGRVGEIFIEIMKNTPRAIMALIIAGLWIFIQFYDGRPVLPSFNIEGMGYFLAAVGVPIILVVYGLKELLKSK